MAQEAAYSAPPAKSRKRSNRQPLWLIYLFIFPAIALALVFDYYPAISGLYLSTTNTMEVGIPAHWIGLANYVSLFTNPIFLASLWHMAVLAAIGIAIGTVVPFLVAEMIFNLGSARWRYAYRVIFLLKMLIPGMVVVEVWGIILATNGVLDHLFKWVGLPWSHIGWLVDPHTALAAVAFIGFPWVAGIGILIYYAGLVGVNPEIWDAASVDGSRGFHRMRTIDLPLVMGQVKLTIILSAIGSFQGYFAQFLLTQGGPGFATMVPGYYMYLNAFQYGQMGMASAIGVFLFLVILALTIVNMKFVRSSQDYAVE
ncbi:MAG: sugar ABC transporter permease [Firmicutes bacterium]|nr:sugar ABC transporter permease [Bacillota bacterium]